MSDSRTDDQSTEDNPVKDGRMPVADRRQDRRPKGPMSTGTDAPDVNDGRPKGPISPSPVSDDPTDRDR